MSSPCYYFNFDSITHLCVRCGVYPPCPTGSDPQAYHEGQRAQLAKAGTYLIAGTNVTSADSGNGVVPNVNRDTTRLFCASGAGPVSYSYENGECIPTGFIWSFYTTLPFTFSVMRLDTISVATAGHDGDVYSFNASAGWLEVYGTDTSIEVVNRPEWNNKLIVERLSPSSWRFSSNHPGRYQVVLKQPPADGGRWSNITINVGVPYLQISNQGDQNADVINSVMAVLEHAGLLITINQH